jgi:myo-inositol-1(or 4)-monophosphatase
MLSTGFPYDYNRRFFTNLDRFRDFSMKCQAVRRDGSAALDLCYVACGRFDGFWEAGLKVWDSAAGAIVIAEAGGRLTDYAGRPFDPFRPECVASNGRIHDEMLAVIAAGETR